MHEVVVEKTLELSRASSREAEQRVVQFSFGNVT